MPLEFSVHPPEAKLPPPVEALCAAVIEDGGHVLSVYREPVSQSWQIFGMIPTKRLAPTPYQRDLSRPHVKRLQEVIEKLDRFVDPVVAVRSENGKYWTPNGNHRLAAMKKLKAAEIPVILIPDPDVAFQILALNTEKAHNVKDKSLEVIRMYRALMEDASGKGKKSEKSFAFQFEEAYYVTLGLVYEQRARFAGSAFSPILRRVDKFLQQGLVSAFAERESRAKLLEEASDRLDAKVAELKSRGVNHPYAKPVILARVNPLGRARKTIPTYREAFVKLAESLEDFDVSKVRWG